jgi:hypothetical protein
MIACKNNYFFDEIAALSVEVIYRYHFKVQGRNPTKPNSTET